MVRPETAKALKAMKEATTGAEMVKSWDTQRPGFDLPPAKPFKLWTERKPEMIRDFAQNELIQMLGSGILDPKTRALIKVALAMVDDHWAGLLPECCSAKAAGATEEELIEVAYLTCAAVVKMKMIRCGVPLADVLENPVFQNIKSLEE